MGLAALGYRDFRLFQGARVSAIVSMEMLNVGVGWQLYATTGHALSLGLVGLAQFAPVFLLSLAAGHVADRFDRRLILRTCYMTLAVAALLLFYLAKTSDKRTLPIYAVLVLVGMARSFNGPAGQALLPHLVATEHIGNAVAWGSSSFKVANIVGPTVGGFLYAWRGPSAVYATAAIGFLCASLFVHTMQIRLGRMEPRNTSLRSVLAGVEYVWRTRIVLGSITIDLFAVLLGGAVALLPIFARDLLHIGPWGLGLLRAAPAFGAAVTAIYLAYHPIERRAGATMFVAVAIFGVATISFGLSHSFALTLISLAIIGASDMVSVFVRMTLLPLVTPPSMRGRVSAVNLVFIGASNELGDFESGVAAEWLGVVPAVIAGGVGTLLVVVFGVFLFPRLARLDRLDAHSAD